MAICLQDNYFIFGRIFKLTVQKMDPSKKERRYQRLYDQIKKLIETSSNNELSNMATTVAVLHHKMETFFWTGFYLFNQGRLQVGPYQGSLACIDLPQDTGVCWAAITQDQTLVVPDVHEFPGHIACDARSRSEIVVPLKRGEKTIGVLDVDSKETDAFDRIDAVWLEKIVSLVLID
jgi:GAF domain-containing protein